MENDPSYSLCQSNGLRHSFLHLAILIWFMEHHMPENNVSDLAGTYGAGGMGGKEKERKRERKQHDF